MLIIFALAALMLTINYSNNSVHFNPTFKLKYFIVFTTETVFHTAAYANPFSASRGHCWSGRDQGFPGNGCTQSSSALINAALSGIIGQIK